MKCKGNLKANNTGKYNETMYYVYSYRGNMQEFLLSISWFKLRPTTWVSFEK